MILFLVLILAITIFLAGRSWGLFSFNLWLGLVIVFIFLGIITLLSIYWRYKRRNEIIKCSNCGRTMTYGVFQRAGGCPKCHTDQYVRTGKWPKG